MGDTVTIVYGEGGGSNGARATERLGPSYFDLYVGHYAFADDTGMVVVVRSLGFHGRGSTFRCKPKQVAVQSLLWIPAISGNQCGHTGSLDFYVHR